jgi:hypothetical protein
MTRNVMLDTERTLSLRKRFNSQPVETAGRDIWEVIDGDR